MKRSYFAGVLLVAAVALLAISPARAACTFDPQPVAHAIGGVIDNCPDAAPVQGHIYLLSAPTATNSNGQDVVCEDGSGTNGAGQPCFAQAGVPGDNMVTVQAEWGSANPGVLGCPNPGQGPDGTTPIGIQVVCNNGNSVFLTMGFAGFIGGFAVEAAHPPDGLGGAAPIHATSGTAPKVLNITGDIFNVQVADSSGDASNPAAGYYTDCDPTAFGYGITCDNSASPRPHPEPSPGQLYKTTGPCDRSPDLRLGPGNWVAGGTLDAAGNGVIQVTRPPVGCAFVGATQRWGGTETTAVAGAFRVQTQGAQTDKFKVDSATFKGNDLKIVFSTENEASLVGFNVYAGNNKLNANTIAAGGGSKSYTFDTTRGALKGNKAIVLEGVFADNTKAKAPAFQLK